MYVLSTLSIIAASACIGAALQNNPYYTMGYLGCYSSALSAYGGHHRYFCANGTGLVVYSDRSGTFLPLTGGFVPVEIISSSNIGVIVTGTRLSYQFAAFFIYDPKEPSQIYLAVVQGYNSVWKLRSNISIGTMSIYVPYIYGLAMSSDASVLLVTNTSSMLVYTGAGGVYSLSQEITSPEVFAYGTVAMSADGLRVIVLAVSPYGTSSVLEYVNGGSSFTLVGNYTNDNAYSSTPSLSVFNNATTSAVLIDSSLYVNGDLLLTLPSTADSAMLTTSFDIVHCTITNSLVGQFTTVDGRTIDVAGKTTTLVSQSKPLTGFVDGPPVYSPGGSLAILSAAAFDYVFSVSF